MKYLSLLLLSVALISCNRVSEKNKIIGIKIYEYNGNYSKLVSKWNEMGINTAFVSVQLASDTTFRRFMRNNNIAVFIIYPVFQDPAALKKDPSLSAITNRGRRAKTDWVEFVCPSRLSFRNKKIRELGSLVKNLNPDGISLDFIRQFVYWEKIYPGVNGDTLERTCYCDSCINSFAQNYDYHIPDTFQYTQQKAEFLHSHYDVAWNDFRTGLIASMVRDLADRARTIKPGIKINVHMVPWRNADFSGGIINVAAQDLKKIAPYADFISPMCYSQMLKRDPAWISDVVTAMDGSAHGKILPSIQVYPYYLNTSFTTHDFKRCLKSSLQRPSLGVVFWSWTLFEKDPARMKVVEGSE